MIGAGNPTTNFNRLMVTVFFIIKGNINDEKSFSKLSNPIHLLEKPLASRKS
jgi:hypothetical protein